VSEVKMAEGKIILKKAETPEEKAGIRQLRRMSEDRRWFFANEEKLRTKYLNKIIAFKNKRVAFTADNYPELYSKIQAAGEDIDDFLYEYMSKEPRCLLF